MAGDVQSFLDAAPLRRVDVDHAHRGKRRWLLLLGVLIAHSAGLYWAMRNGVGPRNRDSDKPIEIALIEQPVFAPVPELRKAAPSLPRSRDVRPATATVSPNREPQPAEPATPSVTIFNPDGSLQLPPQAKPQRGLPEPDIVKGRELMGRGLDCEAPDALGSGESLGEGVARKYLAWIGLYNPYSAQLRAEQRAERHERCKRWRGQT